MNFYGQTYMYPTPDDGEREVGVHPGLQAKKYVVAWHDDSGGLRRVKTPHFPVGEDPAQLQVYLDDWAGKRNLKPVMKGEEMKKQLTESEEKKYLAGKSVNKLLSSSSQHFTVKLTDQELLDRGQRCAELDTKSKQFAASAKAHAERSKGLAAEADEIRTEILSKETLRDIPTETWAAYDKGMAYTIRTDTLAQVAVRALTVGERQMDLPLEAEAKQ